MFLIKIPQISQSAVVGTTIGEMACRVIMAVFKESHGHLKYTVWDKLNLLLLHYMARIVTIRLHNANYYCKTALQTVVIKVTNYTNYTFQEQSDDSNQAA
jgi:hypothetical protein